MTTEQAIRHFGTATQLAESLGITKSAISQWGNEPPEGRQFEIEILTKGVLTASKKQAK